MSSLGYVLLSTIGFMALLSVREASAAPMPWWSILVVFLLAIVGGWLLDDLMGWAGPPAG